MITFAGSDILFSTIVGSNSLQVIYDFFKITQVTTTPGGLEGGEGGGFDNSEMGGLP
jgi:hypothetical protein